MMKLADCVSAVVEFSEDTIDDTDSLATPKFICVRLCDVDVRPSERRRHL